MIMMGMKFAGDVPFRTVFINGLVRDEKGEKMSKTRGNDVDPLEVMEKHGTDALALHACGARGTGHRSLSRRGATPRVQGIRQQALERLAVRSHEPGGGASLVVCV